MINGLIEKFHKIQGIKYLAFADDVAIFLTDQNINITNDNVNKAMTLLENWGDENKMTVNIEKTVCQLFTLSSVC